MKMHTLRGTANLRTGKVDNTVDSVTVQQSDTSREFEMMSDYMKDTHNKGHSTEPVEETSPILDTLKAIHERKENPDAPLEKPKPGIREHYGTVSECGAARRSQTTAESPPEHTGEGVTVDEFDPADYLPDAADLMAAAVETYRARGAVYGKSYDRQGDIMQALFPNGVHCATVEDHRRFGVLTIMISKLARYCNNFATGGHIDSVHDLGVYSFILEELDSRKREDTE